VAITTSDANRANQAYSPPSIAFFICTNCARENGGRQPSAPGRRPAPLIDWPVEVETVVLPCTGKIQPEHLLKAFEVGVDMVCVVGCEEDNCHCLEGSRRAAHRVRYVRGLLNEAGLGGERLLMFHLPGTAREDMAAAFSAQGRPDRGEASRTPIPSPLEAIRDEIMARLESLGPSPLRGGGAAHRAPSMETA